MMAVGVPGNGRIVDGKIIVRQINKQIGSCIQNDLSVHNFQIIEDVAVTVLALSLQLGQQLTRPKRLNDDLGIRELFIQL